MEFIKRIDMTALHLAVEKGNLEIVKVLLSQPKINVNLPIIQNQIF